ncbi:TRAP transporter small permease [Algihabitans albus]|uniref:TRAP transporter small permease n=1 Tax=Algihabitans albus TaxID=2164067 RepID=UPI000E5CDC35|nr:TRAP transporter small permease [Algihabitans albus]
MPALIRVYDGLVLALAVAGAAALGLSALLIVVDVMLRNLGLPPIQAASALIEYAMLAATVGGAPWLVRRGGHVAVDSFVAALPPRAYRWVLRGGLTFSFGVSAFLAWRAAVLTLEAVVRNDVDIRSIDVPGWVAYALLAVGLGLCATEFLRLLIVGGGDQKTQDVAGA